MSVFSNMAAAVSRVAVGTALLAVPLAPQAAEGVDRRVPIELTAPEQDYVLNNMRLHLADVELIVSALAQADAAGAQAAAAHLGTRSFEGNVKRPATLLAKLPPEFLRLTKAYHVQFDGLAADIGRGDPPAQSLQRLGAALQSCVACHATFRITSP